MRLDVDDIVPFTTYNLCPSTLYSMGADFYGNPTSTNWSIINNASGASLYSSNLNSATFSSGSSTGSFRMKVEPSNACGTISREYYFNVGPCGYYRYTVSPNPAKDYLSVAFEQTFEVKNFPETVELFLETSYGTMAPVRKREIRDEASKQQLSASKKITFDVRDLARGRYILRVTKEKEVETETSKKVETIHIVLN